MRRKLLIIIAALLPVATAACSESCAQSRYGGGRPTGTGSHYPSTAGGGLSGRQPQTQNLSGSLQGTRTPQLSASVAGTGVAVGTDTATNVIVKPPPPPPEEPPEADDGGGDENDSGNAVICN